MIDKLSLSCGVAALGALAIVLAPLPSSAMTLGPAAANLLQGAGGIVTVAQKKRSGGGMNMQQMQMIQGMLPDEYKRYMADGIGGMGGSAGSGQLSPPGDVMHRDLPNGTGGYGQPQGLPGQLPR